MNREDDRMKRWVTIVALCWGGQHGNNVECSRRLLCGGRRRMTFAGAADLGDPGRRPGSRVALAGILAGRLDLYRRRRAVPRRTSGPPSRASCSASACSAAQRRRGWPSSPCFAPGVATHSRSGRPAGRGASSWNYSRASTNTCSWDPGRPVRQTITVQPGRVVDLGTSILGDAPGVYVCALTPGRVRGPSQRAVRLTEWTGAEAIGTSAEERTASSAPRRRRESATSGPSVAPSPRLRRAPVTVALLFSACRPRGRRESFSSSA